MCEMKVCECGDALTAVLSKKVKLGKGSVFSDSVSVCSVQRAVGEAPGCRSLPSSARALEGLPQSLPRQRPHQTHLCLRTKITRHKRENL